MRSPRMKQSADTWAQILKSASNSDFDLVDQGTDFPEFVSGYFAADSKVGLDTRTAPQQFPGKTSAGSDGRCSWLQRLPPTLVCLRAKDFVLSGSDVPLLRARALKLPRSLPPQLSDNSQVVGADRDLVVDKKAVEETAEFYDARLLWCQGPHDIMLDPVGLVVVCVCARARSLSL